MKRLFDKNAVTRRGYWASMPRVSAFLRKEWNGASDKILDDDVRARVWQGIAAEISSSSRRYKRRFWMPLGIAASLLFCFWMGVRLFSNNTTATDEGYIEFWAQTDQAYTLPDFSVVWMEADSKIRYSKKFDAEREVWLTGNSTFEVKKNEYTPFRVHLKDCYVEVKGTCFSVRQDDSEIYEITLFSGAVDFVQTDSKKVTLMQPSQRIVYNAGQHFVELEQIGDGINWQNGRYIFTDISLVKLIDYVNLIYNADIVLHPELKKTANFTGSIRYDESLEEVLEKICYVIRLETKREEGKIMLCN